MAPGVLPIVELLIGVADVPFLGLPRGRGKELLIDAGGAGPGTPEATSPFFLRPLFRGTGVVEATTPTSPPPIPTVPRDLSKISASSSVSSPGTKGGGGSNISQRIVAKSTGARK